MSTGSLKIRQSWLSDEIDVVAEDTGRSKDDAFALLASSLLAGCSVDDLDDADWVDGGQDKQIDIININSDEDKGVAHITIIQAKNTSGFGSNTMIKIRNGLDWIFERTRAEVDTLDNVKFRNKILEIRSIRTDIRPSNMSVRVVYATAGDASDISEELKQELRITEQKYMAVGFNEFVFEFVGANEIVELLNDGEANQRKIDLVFPVLFNPNAPSYMPFSQGDTKAIVCTVAGDTLAKIAQVEPRDAIFDLNVRPHYGLSGSVNKDIYQTCNSDDEAKRFWFLNNGVTMVCDTAEFDHDPDNPRVTVKNAQIVNGCQTSATIREAHEKGDLHKDVRILMKVYATDNPALVGRITGTTNNQNPIRSRDLRANDKVQQDIEALMVERFDFYYERKNKQHRLLKGDARKRVVPSPKAAQAVLAIARAKPSNARANQASIWERHYDEIFNNSSVADLLLCFRIYDFCRKKARNIEVAPESVVEGETLGYGTFHVSRALGFLLVEDNWGFNYEADVSKILNRENLEEFFEIHYGEALARVSKVRQEGIDREPIPALFFKNQRMQHDLNVELRGQ